MGVFGRVVTAVKDALTPGPYYVAVYWRYADADDEESEVAHTDPYPTKVEAYGAMQQDGSWYEFIAFKEV